MARVITVTSGKGGVGKTNISVNLALQLAGSGYRTCLFDADLGLANINILLGIYPAFTLEDVITGQKTLGEILVRNHRGIDIIPGSSGIEKLANLETAQIERLIAAFAELEDYDFFIFDTSAGISKNVVSFCLASTEVILIITNEPTSLTDGYALIKILTHNGFKQPVMVVVNQSKNPRITKIAYTKFKETVQRFLAVDILPLGAIAQDSCVVEAVKAQKPFTLLYPNSPAAKGLLTITQNLINRAPETDARGGLGTFWSRFLNLLHGPLKIAGSTAAAKPVATDPPAATSPAPDPAPEEGPSAMVEPAQDEPASGSATATAPPEAPLPPADLPRAPARRSDSLAQSLASISAELAGIRKIMAGGTPHVRPPTLDGAAPASAVPDRIPLDFEGYLQQRRDS